MKLPRYKYFLAVVDFVIVLLTFYVARFLSINLFGKLYSNYLPDLFGVSYNFIFSTIILSIVFIFIFQNNNLYKINIFLSQASHLVSIIRATFYGTILLIIVSFSFKISTVISSRTLVIVFIFLLVVNLVIIRLLLLPYFYLRYSSVKPRRRNLLIIGAGKAGKLLGTKVHFEKLHGLNLIGFLDDNLDKGEEVFLNYSVIGTPQNIISISTEYNIGEIIISIDNITHDRLIQIIEMCNKTEAIVRVNSELFKAVSDNFTTETFSDINAIEISPRISSNLNLILKRTFDFIGAAIGLLILSPVFILIAITIKLSSNGPVLFSQIRIGKNGRPFKFYKFRSMTISDETDLERKEKMIRFMKTAEVNGSAKIINEARITKIGKFLRKTSIDELPQLFNVIKGDMSLVGPRPCLEYEYENYDEWHKKRISVLPGCTGLWQVSGRSSVAFNDSVIMDIYYVNNMSPWFDLQLILKTIPVMIFGRGGK